ncbi:hypothetical protein ABD87_14870 [Lysinibacillus sphaericus]|uniref:helix-turn-helix transcriptional regulator n=1 Tax=Lysinibacillus sphaericus TaxID=1421 RepID=UPI0018CE851C|nr:helix-turn-helix transcriptional regulator [Lysinibacillus sphaericus]MBG9730778.1 hypothetical protein [Lysinibacillus sphaericus]
MKKQIIYKKIRDLRIKNGLSQVDLSKLVLASPSRIGMYETGLSTPSDEYLRKLSKLFAVDFNEIKTMI